MRKRTKKDVAQDMTLLARFGNFLVKSFGDGRNSWIRIVTVDGAWRMDFRDDSMKYGWIAQCLASENEGVKKAVEMWIIVSYHTAHVWPDPQYLDEATDCLGRLQERVSKLALEREMKEQEDAASHPETSNAEETAMHPETKDGDV